MTLNGDSKEIKHHETHDFSRPTKNGPNNGFVFHTKVLALVLLCLFTFFLSLKVQDMIFESNDKTFNDAFISTPKVLMLEMTAATKGLFVYKLRKTSHVKTYSKQGDMPIVQAVRVETFMAANPTLIS